MSLLSTALRLGVVAGARVVETCRRRRLRRNLAKLREIFARNGSESGVLYCDQMERLLRQRGSL